MLSELLYSFRTTYWNQRTWRAVTTAGGRSMKSCTCVCLKDKLNSTIHTELNPFFFSISWCLSKLEAIILVIYTSMHYVMSLYLFIPLLHPVAAPWGFLSFHSFCGSYVGHSTVFRIAYQSPEVEFRCSSRNSAQPFQATYSSYNISQRK